MSDKKNEYQYQMNVCFMPDRKTVLKILSEKEVNKLLRIPEVSSAHDHHNIISGSDDNL